jgi:hypothetical protein
MKRTVPVLAGLLLLAGCGGCAGDTDADRATWRNVVTKCPALEAPTFADLVPSAEETVDRSAVLSYACTYTLAQPTPKVLVHVQIDRDPANHDRAAEKVRAARDYAAGTGDPVIELAEGAYLVAEGTGSVQAAASSGNASITVMAQFGAAVKNETALTEHRPEMEQTLGELLANLV